MHTLAERIKIHGPVIVSEFKKQGMDPFLGLALAMQESAFVSTAVNLTDAGDRKRGGSWGILQMSLRTAQSLGYLGEPQGLLDVCTCAEYAARLCKDNAKRGHTIKDLAAMYNSGKLYVKAPIITRAVYVKNVLKYHAEFSETYKDMIV